MDTSIFCVECGSTFNVCRFKKQIPLCNKHYKQMYRHGKILKRTTFDKNEIKIHTDYAEIILYDLDGAEVGRTQIDREDIEIISGRKWYMREDKYVLSDSSVKNERLHRLLVKCPKGKVVDHIDRNPLNNRKSNLRICNQNENIFNSSIRTDNRTGHTGVVYRTREKKWFAYLTIHGKQKSLGYHNTKNDAIKARVDGELKYYGEYAPNGE